jgi:hypothetical protein
MSGETGVAAYTTTWSLRCVWAGSVHLQHLGNVLYRSGAVVRDLDVTTDRWKNISVGVLHDPFTIICNSYFFDFSYFSCSALPRYPNTYDTNISTTFINIP